MLPVPIFSFTYSWHHDPHLFARGPYAATSDVPTVFWGKRAVLRWHNAGESAIAGVLCQWLNATVNFGVSQESNSLFFLSSGTYWPKTKFPCLLFVIKKCLFIFGEILAKKSYLILECPIKKEVLALSKIKLLIVDFSGRFKNKTIHCWLFWCFALSVTFVVHFS